jgi:CzcA family heavy metal efflux pump
VTRFAIEHRVAVLVFVLGVVIAGFIAYALLPREAAPDVVFPNIIVTVPYFGVAPNDIETLITNPLERELGGIKDLDVMTSTSAEGASSINLQFLPSVEINEALQRVREAVNKVKPDLPPDAEEPIVSEISFSDFPILVIAVSGDFDLRQLKAIADDIQDEIEKIPDVSNVAVSGGLEREIQVNVDPDLLAHFGATLDDVVNAVRAEHINVPGGSVETGGVNYLVRVPAEFESAYELREATFKSAGGVPIRLGQVASVVDTYKTQESYSRIRTKSAVSVSIMKRAGGNLIEIIDQTKARVAEMQGEFPEGVTIDYLADQSVDIRIMVRDLENNILTGLVLVLAVLLVFLGFRTAFFVAVAIPMTMLITFLVLAALGITLNMIVLFSLILALGMMVDNAIVVVENIYRHAEMGKDRVKAAIDGTHEVAWPVITSTLTTLCAFGPLMFWPGIMGQFMSYLPLVLIITLTASLFVALVINPVICAAFLKAGEKAFGGDEDSWFIRLYRASLELSLRWRWLTVLGSFAFLVGSMMAYGVLGHGVEFFPETTPRKVFVAISAPEGTRVEASDAMSQRIESLLSPLDNVRAFVADVGTGGGEMDFSQSSSSNKTRITVDFQEHENWTENPFDTIETIRDGVGTRIAGADVEVQKEAMGPPSGPPVNIELVGENYELLAKHAQTVRRLIRDIPGLADLRDDFEQGRPELQVRVDRALTRQLGIKSTQELANTVRTAVNGQVATKFRELDEEYDVRVRLAERFRDSLPSVLGVEVYGENGLRLPLRLLADVDAGAGSGSIRHKDQKRVVTVSANVEGRNANEALVEVQSTLKGVELNGAEISYTGENEEQQKAQSFLMKALLAALALIILVLVTQFNSLIQPGIIMASVILSLIGVLWGLIITVTPFGVMMTGIGVISLAGVVVNNAIVLIDYTNLLRRWGRPLRDAVVEAGTVRLRPVLLTAITTVLGLVPMATGVGFDFIDFKVQQGGQSSEWWGPMAVAVIFGLSMSTVLTLIVVPTLYYLLERASERVEALFERRPWVRAVVYTVAGLLVVQVSYALITAVIAVSKGA